MENLYIVILWLLHLGGDSVPYHYSDVLVISMRKRLFDVPDERKVHKRPVPRLGGVTFFPVILFSLCVFTALRLVLGIGPQEREAETLISEFLFLMGGLTLLYIIGIGDDLVGVRYRRNFLRADYLGGDVSAVGLVYQQFLWSLWHLPDSCRGRYSADHAAGGVHHQCHQPD